MATGDKGTRFAPHKASVASLRPSCAVSAKPPRPRSSFSSDRTLTDSADLSFGLGKGSDAPVRPRVDHRTASAPTTPVLTAPPIAARVRESDRPQSFAALRAKFGGRDSKPARFPSMTRRVSAPPLTSTPPQPIASSARSASHSPATVPVRATPSLIHAIERVQQAQQEARTAVPSRTSHEAFWRDVEVAAGSE